eukprot:6027898-Pleurochrysis_carterae.AAC.1
MNHCSAKLLEQRRNNLSREASELLWLSAFKRAPEPPCASWRRTSWLWRRPRRERALRAA